MLRRIASLGQQASENPGPMSPSPGDVTQQPETRSTGGLASVFKGLAGSKNKPQPPPPVPQPLPLLTIPNNNTLPEIPSDSADVALFNLRGLPPQQMELFEKLRNGTPNERVLAADSLRATIADYPLNPILDIWYAGKDLIEPSKPLATRAAGWQLLTECVKHDSSTDVERSEYFQTLSAPASPEDFHLQLSALVDLTNHGRDLSGFEYDVIPLLTAWLNDAYHAVRTARRQASAASRSGSNKFPKGKAVAVAVAVAGEDKNFSMLFAFILDVLKFNFKVADDIVVAGLIDTLLDICMNTSVEEDLRSCISVINAIVTFGAIPGDKLKKCVLLLSSIFSMVDKLKQDSWHTLGNLFKSHNGQATLRILLDVLRTPPGGGKEKDLHRDVRGALPTLEKLLSKTTEKGYPPVPFAVLVDGLANAARLSSSKIPPAVLKLIKSLFDGSSAGTVNPILNDEDWCAVFDVAAECGKRICIDADSQARSTSSIKSEELTSFELKGLIGHVEAVLKEHPSDFLHRQDCITFLTKVWYVLPDSAAAVVLDYFKEFRCCFPSDLEWEANLKLVLDGFFLNRIRQPSTRLRALEIVTEVYDMLELVEDQVDAKSIPNLVKQVLSEVAEENDTVVLQETVTFVVSVAGSTDMDLFNYIIDALRGVLANDRLKSPIKSSDRPGHLANQSPSNVVTRGYVQMFMRAMDTNVPKAITAFNAIVHIARSNLCETDARLTAMKMLFRLRADWANRIFLTPFTESEGLARYLYRTEASLARKLADDAAQPNRLSRTEQGMSSRTSRGVSFGHGQPQERVLPTRAMSGPKPTSKYQQLWQLPDADALPDVPSPSASPILFSHTPITTEVDGANGAEARASLDLASWLDSLLSLFHQGCDWEVYSFVLVHLPSQLSNHAIFKDAVPQIQELRRVVCELIRMNSFQEPPNSSGLRRADVSICLFHTLTMILSYHQHFQKAEEDEIVRTFMQGIADRTAKTCIHGLSICCHELPMSVSKSLVTILQKMSTIITQPFVAMHILEFLACLSRLYSLYSNFREEEYRTVFGICFRYLQYVRDKKLSVRASHASDGTNHLEVPGHVTASDDLPQYVYALAYHVITFWFLALKLPDRPNHIGWIAKNLFTDVDGSQSSDEQAQITIDFMQRVTYSDVNDSVEDPLFTEERFGEILHKKWIIGNSIVSIKQAKETGWAEITKRQPSGTSSFTIRESFRAPLPHQTSDASDYIRDGHFPSSNTTLPSYLLVQLLSSIPQSYDPALRPIPLPDDEAVSRAIRQFDRSSTVDGHKVGVIYVGENQTKESEILANVSGSQDYVKFLGGLGILTKLKGATFNTQGLDREYDTDGQYTFCWRDRVTEIVFHVTTQMPTNVEQDPNCVNKKRHIGNDFVNIIFNDSGLPFRFNTFPSDFNYVNIVITPESRASFVASRETAASRTGDDCNGPNDSSSSPFYKVRVMSKPGFPEVSAAADTKMVSLKALPGFVRLLALNASVFSHVWANREGGEHISSWRNRLREISRLRERHGPKLPSLPPSSMSPPPPLSGAMAASGGPGQGNGHGPNGTQQQDGSRPSSSVRDSFSSLRRASVATFFTNTSEQTQASQASHASHRSSVLSTATTDTEIMPMNGVDSLVDSLDFSKWA